MSPGRKCFRRRSAPNDVQGVDDSAAAEVKETLASMPVAVALSLPALDTKHLLDQHTLPQLGPTVIVPDALIRPSSVTDGNNHQTSDAYAPNSNKLGNDGLGEPTKALSITYNPENQTTSIADAQSNTTGVTYDAHGNVTTITNQLASQNRTQLIYNSNGTVNHVIDARGNTTSYGYDTGNKNLTSIRPPRHWGRRPSCPTP